MTASAAFHGVDDAVAELKGAGVERRGHGARVFLEQGRRFKDVSA
jgi:hypothetical protein